MSRCTHWMHADCLRRSPAEALGEVSPQARRTQFRIGRRIAGPPRGHGFCWRRSPQVPCLIRKVGLAAEAAAKAVKQAVAAVEAEAVELEEAPAEGVLSPATTHLPIANRERSCRNFQRRLPRISRFLLR